MSRRLPLRPQSPCKKRICIVCEGHEEIDYLKKLRSLHLWNKEIYVELYNAKGISRIPAIYQSIYQNEIFDFIFILCDTETPPYADYKRVVQFLKNLYGKSVDRHLLFFANPCSMQIILKHLGDVKMTNPSKAINANLIMTLTGIANYQASSTQRESLFSKINEENYLQMKIRLSALNGTYQTVGYSNFVTLLNNLENSSLAWLRDLYKLLDT